MNGRKGMLLSLFVLAAMTSPLAAQEAPKADSTHKAHQAVTAKHATHRATRTRSTYPRLRQERPGLLAETAVSPDSATHVALKGSEGARVVARRLVKRGDNLVYVISVRPKGAKASRRIDVDAKTAAVLETAPTKRKTSGKTRSSTRTKTSSAPKGS